MSLVDELEAELAKLLDKNKEIEGQIDTLSRLAYSTVQYKNEMRKMHNSLIDGTVKIQSVQDECGKQLVEINGYIETVEEPKETVVCDERQRIEEECRKVQAEIDEIQEDLANMDDEEMLREKIQAKQKEIDELNKKQSEEKSTQNEDYDDDNDDDSDDSDETNAGNLFSRFFIRSPSASFTSTQNASFTT